MPHEFNDDTLGDIQERDIDNLTYVMKNAKTYTFTSLNDVLGFSGEALNKALNKFGVDIREFLNRPEAMDPELQRKGLRVEHRNYDTPEDDRDRSGIYVYHAVGDNSEIVAFIGKPQPGRILGSYTIKTTVII